MNIYVGIFAAVIILGLSVHRKAKLQAAYASALLLFLFAFSAFRFEVGCDWFTYEMLFDLYSTFPLWEASATREPGFYLMLSILGGVGMPYVWANILTTAVLCLGVYNLSKTQPNRLGFVLLCFPFLFIVMAMSGIRQAAAIGFICVALYHVFNRKLMVALIWVILATAFHNSSAVFFLFIPFISIQKTRYKILFLSVVGPIVAYLILRSAAFDIALDRYVDTGFDAAGAYARISLLGISSAMMLFYRKRWRSRFPEDYRFIVISAFAMLLLVPLTAFSTVIGDRIGYYFIPLQAIIFSRMVYLEKGLTLMYVGSLPYVMMEAALYVWATRSSLFQSCYLPYQTIF